MSKQRFLLLEIEMVRRGVALRHARRAALELESHHRELTDQALSRGETLEQAEQSAHAALGSDALLIERYACQKELRSMAHSCRAGYVLAPLLGFLGISVAAMWLLVTIVTHLPVALHHIQVPGLLTHGVDFTVSTFFLWVLPVAVATGFGALANRQRIAFRWPLAGIVLLCLVSALANVSFVLTGGPQPGFARAGLTLDLASLPNQLLHAACTAALALAPVAWLRHRASLRGLPLE
jgi:hypothetical protein